MYIHMYVFIYGHDVSKGILIMLWVLGEEYKYIIYHILITD